MNPEHNATIANLFNQLADLLEIQGDNPFRIRAYRNAARVIDSMTKDVASLIAEGYDLKKLPGIGPDLEQKIKTIIATGELPELNKVAKKTPLILTTLLQIESLGPKRVQILYKKLHVKNIADLERALKSGKIKKLRGFGEKTEAAITAGLARIKEAGKRVNYADVCSIAEKLITYLKKIKGVKKAEIAGSFRRCKETVADLDILVIANFDAHVIEHFVHFPEVEITLSKGETRSTVRLKSGLQIDLRVLPVESYGAGLLYFTGSKAHNIALRKMALDKKLMINEYGVFKNKKQIAGKTEKEIYKLLGLSYIEPELREDQGEIEAAQKNQLPKLITLNDIRGDLHCHTNETDGINSLEQMAQAAKERGYEYLAITDHSKNVTVANGLDKNRLLKQIKAIDKLNEKLKGITILKSIELDILENGDLDLPNDVLKHLDLTICSIHSYFNLSEKKQTERVLRAMDNPYFNIFAHPTGRLIAKRNAYAIDLEKIMKEAKARNCFLELDSQPDRLDLNDIHCRMAKEMGIKISISSDAHSVKQLGYIQFGINQARRGWIEKQDVLNTYSLSELKKLLKRK